MAISKSGNDADGPMVIPYMILKLGAVVCHCICMMFSLYGS